MSSQPLSPIPTSSVRSQAMAHQDALRFSYFQRVRRENPHEYYLPKTQAQMARAYREQGFLFFDLGGLHH